MKAFKQLNYRFEKHFFWSYTLTVSFISIFVLISPVLAQSQKEEANEPEIEINVKKEYDENGNLVRIDSSRSWCWHGKSYTFEESDSIFKKIEENLGHFFHRNQVTPFGLFSPPPGPPLHRFWDWHEADSSVTSFFDQFNDADFFSRFDKYSNFDNDWGLPLSDSLWTWPDYFNERFNEGLHNEHQIKIHEFTERFKQYQEEHQQLIEKYFGQPKQNEDKTTPIEPNLNIPGKIPNENKSGKT